MANKIYDGFDVISDTRTEDKVKKPSKWNVVIFNDDFTPFDFVIFVLMHIYNKPQDEAEAITFQVHVEKKGIAGTYTHEVAETKLSETMRLAKLEQHPLRLEIERVD